MAKASMYFPPDFMWGTATSAHQVEGNNNNNDWWLWEKEPGRVLNGDRSGIACDWWRNAETDLDHAAEMGTRAHRLSIEWSRIEPEPSVFSDRAIDRYRQILLALHQRGIEPMVTLHHFTNPIWLVEKGDFDTDLVVDYFHRFVGKVVSALGDLVPKWITFNEPMVYFLMRYLEGAFPAPVASGWLPGLRALKNMLECHARAYKTIKDTYPKALVGIAKHHRPIQAWPPGSFLDRWWARRASGLFNDLWMECLHTGRLHWPIGRAKVKWLKGSFDFVGINYYSRALVRFPPRPGRLYEQGAPAGAVMVDGDFFESYPEGLYMSIKENLKYKKPIYITEHGIPDVDDKLRPAVILSHLREIWRAINFNFPVMGYYHWTLVDNFEWERGWSQRFGLIALDPDTHNRTWRPSARLYKEICGTNCISSDMAEQYAPSVLDSIFPG